MGSKDTCQVGKTTFRHMHSDMLKMLVREYVCVYELAKLVLALIEFVNILVMATTTLHWSVL